MKDAGCGGAGPYGYAHEYEPLDEERTEPGEVGRAMEAAREGERVVIDEGAAEDRPDLAEEVRDEVRPDQRQPVRAVGASSRQQLLECRAVARRRGHNELAAAGVGHVVLRAKGIEPLRALDGQPRFQRSGRVVDAGMDHFAIARTGAGADGLG